MRTFLPITQASAAPIKWISLAAYGLPGLPLAVLLLPLFVYLPAYYATDLGLGLASVGVVLFIARLWDVVSDPLIGALSDRWQGRHGRRRPWMLAGLPVVMIGAAFLLLPGAGVGWLYLLIWTSVLYLGLTMIALPYAAWGAEISMDYQERSRISAWREGMMVVGILLVTGVPALMSYGNGEALVFLATVILIVLPPCLLVACFLVPERRGESERAPRLKGGWRLIAQNRPFRRLIAAYLLNGVANGLPATLFLLYVTYVLRQEAQAGLYLFVYFACGIAALPLWVWFSGRVGKHRCWNLAMVIACSVFLLVPFLGPGDGHLFVFICVVTGICLGADLALPPSMQADVIDVDRYESEEERAGIFFALWGIATKLALALAVGLAFPLLELAGFSAEAENTALALVVLTALYCLAPVAFKLAAVGLMVGYPLTAEKQSFLRKEIERRSVAVGGCNP